MNLDDIIIEVGREVFDQLQFGFLEKTHPAILQRTCELMIEKTGVEVRERKLEANALDDFSLAVGATLQVTKGALCEVQT